MVRQNATRACPLLLLIPCLAVLAAAGPADASKHLWPLAAIHFDEPAPETPTFKMTEDEFRNEQSALESRITRACHELLASLPYEQGVLLNTAQSSWRDCFEKYDRALKERLDEPVKVFYGIEGEERKTNVYKDTMLAVLEYRAQDLERWSQGCFGYLQPDGLEDAQMGLSLSRTMSSLDKAFGANIYIMDEVFRTPMQEAQDAWFACLRSNAEFVREATDNDEAAAIAEELLQVQRMYRLTLLQKEGYVFFHRERED